jgi:hypothetical protein
MALAKDYWQGVSSDDPAATCKTLAPSERAHFKKKFGSCAKAFTFTAKQRNGSGSWRAGIVELSGDGAKITTVGDSGGE